MATILDLYKSATRNKVKNEIYEGNASFIESKGVIDVARTAALLASSPNAVADIIGTQASGVLKGSANRPSDTIYKDKKPFSKPITVTGGVSVEQKKIKDTIEEGTQYFVKKSPAPASLYSKIKQGASSPLGMASAQAASALSNPLATIRTVKNLANSIKNANNDADMYGTKFMQDENGNTLKADKKFSQFIPNYTATKNKYSYDKSGVEYVRKNIDYPLAPSPTGDPSIDMINAAIAATKTKQRKNWDLVSQDILQYQALNETEKRNYEKNYVENRVTHVEILQYGKSEAEKIILPGTISGLSESYSPDWTGFKYIGSPFTRYRYSGVESSINFSLKMYYTDEKSKKSMRESLHKLKSLVFPYEELSVISYGKDANKKTEALAFSPNLLRFSITGLYWRLFGFLEELSFSIDDSVSWATMGSDMSGNKEDPYPTVIDVTLGFKVIPEIEIQNNKIKYDFDGYNKNIAVNVSKNVISADDAMNNMFNTQNP